MSEQETNQELVIYRLNGLETKLDKLISQQDEAQQARVAQAAVIGKIQDDIQEIKDTVRDHEDRIRTAETAPMKTKAQNWETITKLILETLAGAALAVILVKIGLK